MTEKNENVVSVSEVAPALLVLVGVGFMIYASGDSIKDARKPLAIGAETIPQAQSLLVRFGNLGPELVSSGVIDKERFLNLYDGNDLLKTEAQKVLNGASNGDFIVTEENAPVALNFLWALGLGNKNPILEQGPMMDPHYGGSGNFASTGGWILARGDAMSHYGKHLFITLTPEEQSLVERVSKNIYRPCCDNSTYFPDCNHGMAMLGLLELLVSRGANEKEMYEVALAMNSYWFPNQYETIARYVEVRGIKWSEISAKDILGAKYSSASGYRAISSAITSREQSSKCGV